MESNSNTILSHNVTENKFFKLINKNLHYNIKMILLAIIIKLQHITHKHATYFSQIKKKLISFKI